MLSPTLCGSSKYQPCSMHRTDVDEVFDSDEVLFRRVWPRYVLRRKLLAQSFRRLHETEESVNRSKYSSSRCVLCDEIYERDFSRDCAVMAVPVKDLPGCHLVVKHSPRPANYSHCDLGLESTVYLDEEQEARIKQLLADAMEEASLPACSHHP